MSNEQDFWRELILGIKIIYIFKIFRFAEEHKYAKLNYCDIKSFYSMLYIWTIPVF